MSRQPFRRAKIVCTIGPASRDIQVFRAMAEAGMDAVRVNFSHATHRDAAAAVSMARDVSRELKRPLAVIADLQGPKIRVGDLPGPLPIEEGTVYHFVADLEAAGGTETEPGLIPTTYPELSEDLSPGDRVLLDDGALEFRVIDVDRHTRQVRAEAVNSGVLRAQKGINLPGVEVRARALTEKDLDDLGFACTQHVDYVALSFVRRSRDVSGARELADPGTLIIAKIEKEQALQHLGEIVQESDGVMVARGDLGVELPYEDVPMAQKRIIRECQVLARPVITATQMLESMVTHPRPTRAEVSDVANALLDGTDAVMLSAETATGSYPVEVVHTMARIIRRIEAEAAPGGVSDADLGVAAVQHTPAAAIAAATLQAVDRLEAPFIATFTRSGFTARLVSAQRPPVPILAVTDQWRTYSQLALVWGVHPLLFRGEIEYEAMLECIRSEALASDFGHGGQWFVVTAGVPFNVPGTTNLLRVEEL